MVGNLVSFAQSSHLISTLLFLIVVQQLTVMLLFALLCIPLCRSSVQVSVNCLRVPPSAASASPESLSETGLQAPHKLSDHLNKICCRSFCTFHFNNQYLYCPHLSSASALPDGAVRVDLSCQCRSTRLSVIALCGRNTSPVMLIKQMAGGTECHNAGNLDTGRTLREFGLN